MYQLFIASLKMVLRDRQSLFWALIFPVIFLGVFRIVSIEDYNPEPGLTFFEFLAPGIIGMGLLSFNVIGLAGSLSRYREEGVLRQLRATPLKPWTFSVSVICAHLIVALIQIFVLLGVTYILGVDLISYGLVRFVFVAMLGTFIFLNLGAIVAQYVHGRGAVESAANAVTLPMLILSGSFFPTSQFPQFVQWFVEILPLTHMLRALRSIGLSQDPINEQIFAIIVLLIWSVISFVFARSIYRLQDT